MHNALANIKEVRNFNFVHQNHPKDPAFIQWQEQWPELSIEIGCGAGLHPIRWCEQNPKRALLALERTKVKFQSFEQRIKSHNPQNLYPVNEDALDWLPQHIKPQSVSEYFQ